MRDYDFKFAGAIVFICVALSGCGSNRWSPREMSSQRGLNVPAQLRGTSLFCGLTLPWCTFDLNYFYGTDWVEWSDASSNNDTGAPEVVGTARERRKYLLYIPGGPGDVVDRYNPPLGWKGVNRVYFDVRGTGLSMIPDSNAYDEFLRAEYVADDIETLRQQIFRKVENECMDGEFPLENECRLGRTPWDAIYAHSWGTVVAQIYAWKYPKSVDKVILSAPVSRAVADTAGARRAMIVNNLMKIYETYTTGDCSWPSDEDIEKEMFKVGILDRDPLTENFCFLGENQKQFIKNRLRSLLYQIEREYGSTTFVSRAYSEILKSPDGNFRKSYRYPLEFFRALRQLEWSGSGEVKGFRFDPFVKEQQIDAALFVGYYLLLSNKPVLPSNANERPIFRCDTIAPFLETIPIRTKTNQLRRVFCRRIEAAEGGLRNDPVKDSSYRAWTVFGIYDGIARWISELLEREGRTDNDGCFKDSDLRQVANGTLLPNRPFFQTILKKLGSSSEVKICPWNPARYRHRKETLILTGDADPVTAGEQAMDFYENGLSPGKRAIIIFPRAGHEMQPQKRFDSDNGDDKGPSDDIIRTKIAETFYGLVDSFLNLTVGQFVEDQGVKDRVDEFGAKMLPCKADLPQKKDPC